MARLKKIRTFPESLHHSDYKLGKIAYKIALNTWLFVKFFMNSRYRSERITRIRYPKEMIQSSSATRMNRYPDLFKNAAKDLIGIPEPKILSFGCSSGEEVFTIKAYIPNAKITGVDINHRVLSMAKKKVSSEAIRFIHYRNKDWISEAPYDCIFALAVFQKSEHRDPAQDTALESFTFKQFNYMIHKLDSILKPGGMLVLDHIDFAFQDLPISKKYSISEIDQLRYRERPTLSKQNTRSSSTQEFHRVFIKEL